MAHHLSDGLADAWSTSLVAASLGGGRSAVLEIRGKRIAAPLRTVLPRSFLFGVVFGFTVESDPKDLRAFKKP